MKCLLLLTLAVLTLGQERCQAPLVPEGRCSLFNDCPFLHPVVRRVNIVEFLRNYGGCGKRNGDLRLCCPVSSATNRPPPPVTSSRPLVTTTASLNIVPCVSPSHFIPSLGCITLVKEGMPWKGARQNCIKRGGRLLQDIASYDELQQLAEHFTAPTGIYGPWLGIIGGKWAEGGDPVLNGPLSSSLWQAGEPDGGDAGCGTAHLDSSPSLYDMDCQEARYSLCQRK